MIKLTGQAERILLHITGLTCCGSSTRPIDREPGWRDSGAFNEGDPVVTELELAGLVDVFPPRPAFSEFAAVRANGAGIAYAKAWQDARRAAKGLRLYAATYDDGYEVHDIKGGWYASRSKARYAIAIELVDYVAGDVFAVMRRLRVRRAS